MTRNNGLSCIDGGLIVAHHGVSVEVRFSDDSRRTVRVRRNSGHVVGDRVAVTGEHLVREPRATELRRRDARGGIHLVAANLDVLGIVMAPSAQPGFIDRAIVAARAARLLPFVIANKCDLPEGVAMAETQKRNYGHLVPFFTLSAKGRTGLDALSEFLAGRRGAFIGSTGVGKSSLLNALCPHIDLQVGSTGEYKNMGRHTTTVATLHTLPSGGELVDTPGFRDFGLVSVTSGELTEYFPGFERNGGESCRFSDCRHRTEPGCAITGLVERGELPRERYDTFLKLLEEVEAEEERIKSRSWR